MGNYELLKAAINEVIKANGRQEITGEVLNQVLLSMVNSLGAGYQCMGVATPSTNPGTPDQNVFYFATQAGTYTNFNAIVLQAGISVLIWDGDWASQTWFTVESTPTNNSQNLIASGAVFNALKLDGGAYDVTAHNSGATFASLSALLNSENLATLIPTEIRHGGMSIKFVRSSDNKYVQYMYMSTSTAVADFTNVANWEKTNLAEEVSQLGQDLGDLELYVKGTEEYDGVLSIGALYPDGKVYSAHDTFRTTDYIFLKSWQKFVSTAVNEIVGGQSYPNMCVYSVPDVSGLISAISAQSAQGFEYTATQDCYVRFSNTLEKWVAPNIVDDNSIESRLDGIEPQVADVVSRLDSMKVYENVVQYSGNENVGALHNDGKIYPEHTTFRTSDFIQLKRGMSLYSSQKNEIVNQQTYPNLCVYSSANDNSFIAGVYATQQYGFEYTATQDCYVRFTNLEDYFSFDISDILTPIVHTIEMWVKELYEQGMVLKGKKIGFLGDSITAYGQYISAFAEKTRANVVNYGVSGTTIANSSAGQSFIQRVAQMDNDLDIVVVFGGVNDQRLPVPLGTFENRNTDGSLDNTFYGALHTLCRSLFAKYAGKPIIFITPMHNSYRDETYGDTGDINYYEYTTNGLIVENKFPLREKTYIDDSIAVGDVLSKYRKAIIDVCALYSFPVIDMYAISGLFPIIEQNAQLYTLDGIHPNAFGGNHIADLMIPKIVELLNS